MKPRFRWLALPLILMCHRAGAQREYREYDVTGVIEGPDCGFFGAANIFPTDMTEDGQVAGFLSCPPGGEDQAFIWPGAGELIQLPMPDGTIGSRAYDISENGCIVGAAIIPPDHPKVAFRTDGVETVTLGVLEEIDANWSVAMGVNGDGQIAALADRGSNNLGLVLSSVNRPIADATGNCLVNANDILAVLTSWGPCPGCPADVNADGVVDWADLLLVLEHWSG